jgi:hypothetical protein
MYAMSDDRMSADRGKAVEAALSNIEKKFGKGSIMRLGEREVSDVPAISTTSLSLDAAVGVGGVPRGRIVEIMVQRVRVRRRWRFTLLPKRKRREAWRLTSMPNTRWTLTMLGNLGSISLSS